MKRIALVVGITLATATPATADIAHRITSSVALTVDAAASNATRVPSVYSVSGTNVTPSDGTTSGRIGGLSALSSGTAVGYSPTEATITTAGDAFSFSESFIEGDDVGTSTSVSSGVAASLPAWGSTVTSSGGVAGSLAGSVASDHALSITAGGAGTTAQAQTSVSLELQ